MKITINGKKVSHKTTEAFLAKTWKKDGRQMLKDRKQEAREYAIEECGQPLSWMDGMEIQG